MKKGMNCMGSCNYSICVVIPGSPENPFSRLSASFLQNSTHIPQPLQSSIWNLSFFPCSERSILIAPVGQIPLHNGQQVHSWFTDKLFPNRERILFREATSKPLIIFWTSLVFSGTRRLLIGSGSMDFTSKTGWFFDFDGNGRILEETPFQRPQLS